MTRVYCTNKLKGFIGTIDETFPADYNDIRISHWYAHLFFVDKKKCIVFVNILTYYTVFIADIVKKDVKNIDELFEKRLKEQMLHDKLVLNFENTGFITEGSKIHFIKTSNNKKAIGRINDFAYTFKAHCFIKYRHLNEMDIVHENGLINEIPTGKYEDSKNSYTSPIENVIERMKIGL